MNITALIMAGGKGTRMTLSEEKPLLLVGGKPVIEHVIKALKDSKKINSIVVAVSGYTPKTTRHLQDSEVAILKTPGKEYVSDMAYAIKILKLQTVLTIPADMPLLTGKIIDDVVRKYVEYGKPALAVVVPLETKQKLGMSLSYSFEYDGKSVVPAGININDGTRIDEPELDQAIYIVNSSEVAVNINTIQELQIAEKEFLKLKQKKK